MRTVEDYHVDRPGVEVQQCMKLTGTNRSIGLIVLIASAHRAKPDGAIDVFKEMRSSTSTSFSFWFYPAFAV